MPLVSSRFSAHVNDAASKLTPFGTQVVVLNFKFRNRVLGRNNEWQVDIPGIKRLSVQIDGALIGKRTANLIICEIKGILADNRALGVSLWNHGGSNRREIKNIAAIQRELIRRASSNNLAER